MTKIFEVLTILAKFTVIGLDIAVLILSEQSAHVGNFPGINPTIGGIITMNVN
jgi:hypothetical protein